ncbi:MAG TPA: O-antigen ligase family protein [Gaiellaceae bacterium]|nr:O-antigen ligase family protein [Gaiellaceae bacterium]
MTHETLAEVAALAGAAGAAIVVLGRPHRWQLAAGMCLLAAAEAMLVVALLPGDDLERLASAKGAGVLVLGAVAALGGAWMFVRWPAVVPVALLLAAPFRIPVELGSQDAFLLLPLYVVLAAAALALLFRAFRGDELAAIPIWLAAPAAALIGWVSLSLLWALDAEQGSIVLLFFVFPFAALLGVVARSPWAAWLPRALAVSLVGLATLFAAIGLYQAWTHTLVFAQDLRVANAYTTYFRVTSLFKDPSIYGRQLVLALSLLVVLLWLRRARPVAAAVLAAVVFAGLYFSYSQSSLVVLFATVLTASLYLADRLSRNVLVAVAAAMALAGGAFAAAEVSDHGVSRATSGRTQLVSVTARVIENHPVAGVGIGSQPRASKEEVNTRRRASKNASHTTPLTVLAELGAVGFALYLAFLAGAAWLLLKAVRRDRVVGLGLSVCFLVLVLHSLFYSGFFEDPVMWGVLGVAAMLTAARRPAAG